MKAVCPNCGSEIEDGELFCGECGQKIEAAAQNNGQTEPVSQAAKSVQQTAQPESTDGMFSLPISSPPSAAKEESSVRLYVKCFKAYGRSQGRASKKEFWAFTIINLVIYFILFIALSILVAAEAPESALTGLSLLYTLFLLIVITPSITVTIRRLHDIGKSGAWALLALVPFVNLYLLALLLKEGDTSENIYGAP